MYYLQLLQYILNPFSCLLFPTDIDECLIDNDGCDQSCANEDGGFTCSCYPGYLPLDVSHCIGKTKIHLQGVKEIHNLVWGLVVGWMSQDENDKLTHAFFNQFWMLIYITFV